MALAYSRHVFTEVFQGLPGPSGSLSNIMTSRAVALANKEVDKVMGEAKKKKTWSIHEVRST